MNSFFTAVVLLAGFSVYTEACSSSSAADEYRVIKKTDSDGKQVVVAIGDDAKLSCETNVPWKKCIWKPPRNGIRQLKCEFNREKLQHVSCPSFPEVHFDETRSEDNTCSIVVRNIGEHHEGNWRCEFEADIPDAPEKVIIKDKVSVLARAWRYP